MKPDDDELEKLMKDIPDIAKTSCTPGVDLAIFEILSIVSCVRVSAAASGSCTLMNM